MVSRLDRAVIKNPWMNRMYSLVQAERGLYLIHTGPAVKIGMKVAGSLNQYAVSKVVDRGLRKIEAAEAEIASGALDTLSRGKHSHLLPPGAVTEKDFRKRGSLRSARKPVLVLRAGRKKYRLEFPYTDPDEVERFVEGLS